MTFVSVRMLLQIFIWILIWFWMTSVYLYDQGDFSSFLLFNLQRLPVIITATYLVNYWVVFRCLVATPSQFWKGGILFLAIFLGATLIDRMVSSFNWIEPTLNGLPLEYKFINPIAIFKNAFLLLGVLGMAATFEFFQATVKQQKQIFQLKEEKLETELAFLRGRINPHFLFNTFNNLYSIAVREGSTDLANGLSGMAGLMRYLTYESQVPHVPLLKEISLLQSYIEIQRLRMDDEGDMLVNFRTEGDFSDFLIVPVIFLPLVENSFKHGIVPGQPFWIDISLYRKDRSILFEVKNKKPFSSHKTETGIGLKNLRQRLELIYPHRHELMIIDEYEIFKVTLKVNL